MQWRQRHTTLGALGILVVVVTFETRRVAGSYVEDMELSWPLLIDASRTLYRPYGMGHGRWWNIWGPATCWAYTRSALHGRRPRRPSGDPNQLGGDVLIDPEGIVHAPYVGSGPAHRPSVESLLRIVGARAG